MKADSWEFERRKRAPIPREVRSALLPSGASFDRW
jgi:hypothetical protein